jgi:hypothetical protein
MKSMHESMYNEKKDQKKHRKAGGKFKKSAISLAEEVGGGLGA